MDTYTLYKLCNNDHDQRVGSNVSYDDVQLIRRVIKWSLSVAARSKISSVKSAKHLNTFCLMV